MDLNIGNIISDNDIFEELIHITNEETQITKKTHDEIILLKQTVKDLTETVEQFYDRMFCNTLKYQQLVAHQLHPQGPAQKLDEKLHETSKKMLDQWGKLYVRIETVYNPNSPHYYEDNYNQVLSKDRKLISNIKRTVHSYIRSLQSMFQQLKYIVELGNFRNRGAELMPLLHKFTSLSEYERERLIVHFNYFIWSNTVYMDRGRYYMFLLCIVTDEGQRKIMKDELKLTYIPDVIDYAFPNSLATLSTS